MDDFFTKKRTFIITIYQYDNKEEYNFRDPFTWEITAYSAFEALWKARERIWEHNENRRPSEPKWMEGSVQMKKDT